METILRSIGIIKTRFSEQTGTPVQGSMVPDEPGIIELDPMFGEGLLDLEGFSHLWLIYWLHGVQGWTPRVTPYLDTVEHGVFATRSPRRPNPIGLTAVRLVSIRGLTLEFAGADMLDGTPLLDIKPYLPAFDQRAAERIGWFQGKQTNAEILADGRFIP